MKATGIVRRIDDLGRVVIPKEIRRTMRIREGDPLEIYTDTDGQVIFKKYSPMGELSEFAAQICDALHKTTGGIAAVCDRDAVIAVAGGGKRELLDRRISRELEELMSTRGQYAADSCTLPVVDTDERYAVSVAAPILSEGDVLGCVLFVAAHGDDPPRGGEVVQQGDHALGRVVAREVVARPMVEQVAQQQDAVGALLPDGGHEALRPVGGAVDVGCDEELHAIPFQRIGPSRASRRRRFGVRTESAGMRRTGTMRKPGGAPGVRAAPRSERGARNGSRRPRSRG